MNNFDPNYLGSLTSELAGILRQETESLKTMQIADIKPLLARKQEIALAMEKQREFLQLDPTLISHVTAEQRNLLKKIAADYDEAIQAYQIELFKAQRVNAAIINRMAEYVRDHVQQNRGYNKTGTQSLSGTELAKNTPAIKYNESI